MASDLSIALTKYRQSKNRKKERKNLNRQLPQKNQKVIKDSV